MEERIFGTECEYALFRQLLPHRLDAGGAGAGAAAAAAAGTGTGTGSVAGGGLIGEALLDHLKEMSALLVSALHGRDSPVAGEFLANGGRFYIDRGGHPEYATPECRSVKDLVAHEKAGDRLVQALVEEARAVMAREHIPGELHIFKNNLDTHGSTYGSHENYLITPQAMEQIWKIVPFLVTRQIFTGAGKIVGGEGRIDAEKEPECFPFSLSQRADFIDRVFSDRTRETRGIINTRKREITHQGQSIRLHVILGDSSMSEYALALKIGTTALVLRLLEEDGIDGLPAFSKPVQALKRISRCRGSVHAMQGRSTGYTAHEVQCMHLDRALRFYGSNGRASAEEKMVLDLWERTLVGLKGLRISSRTGAIEDDPGELTRKLDWVLKLWLLNRTREKRGLAWNDPHLRHMDFKYHDLDPETGIFERCEALELVDRVVGEDHVRLAQKDPPSDTRAWMRGAVIKAAAHRNVDVIIEDWESIKLVAKVRNLRSLHPFDRHQRLVHSFKADLKDPFEHQCTDLLARVSQFMDMWDGR